MGVGLGPRKKIVGDRKLKFFVVIVFNSINIFRILRHLVSKYLNKAH